MYVLIFSTNLSETYFILEEMSKVWSQMYIGLHVKYPLFLSNFNETWIFLTGFQKILKHQTSWISIQWEMSCSMQTDMTKLTVAFHNFVKVPKNLSGGLGIDTTRSWTEKHASKHTKTMFMRSPYSLYWYPQ
jgi:hypothetical protein